MALTVGAPMELPRVAGRRRVPAFLAGCAAIWAALLVGGLGGLAGGRGLAALARVAATAAIVERLVLGTPARDLVRRLGVGRPVARPVLVALVVGAATLAVYPALALLTGTPATLRPDWPWLLVSLVAFHGLAEEIGWRAYAFGHLRAGRTRRRAILLTMPLIAATHLPIVATAGPAVGAAAMLVAAVTTVPFVRLYEAGRDTVWAPALLHAAIDAFKLVTLPAGTAGTFSLLLAATSLVVPLAVLPLLRPRRGRPPAAAGVRRSDEAVQGASPMRAGAGPG